MAFLIAFFPFLISSLSFLIIYPTTLRAPQCNTIKITFLCERVLFYELLTPCLPAVSCGLVAHPAPPSPGQSAARGRREQTRSQPTRQGRLCLPRPSGDDWRMAFKQERKAEELAPLPRRRPHPCLSCHSPLTQTSTVLPGDCSMEPPSLH